MIRLELDHHDFLAAVEGFALGSHLRQGVWEDIVFKSIPQMSELDINFLWWAFRRNLWDSYFHYDKGGVLQKRCGSAGYLHALAALHLGNRSYVRFMGETDKKPHKALCYTFQGLLRPLYVDGGNKLQRFNAFIPGDSVLRQKVVPMPDNGCVEMTKKDLWTDLSIYNNKELL